MTHRRETHHRHIVPQWIAYMIAVFVFRVRNKLTVRGTENIKRLPRATKLILAGNHRSRYDIFLVSAGLPLRGAHRINPQRPMTDKYFLDHKYIGPVIHILGSFPHVEANGLKPLARAKRILETGQPVLMFPEGKITDPFPASPRGKVGALWLLREVPDAVIVPFKITMPLRTTFRDLLRGGMQIGISYGKPYRPRAFDADLQKQTDALMATIYALP